MAGWLDYFDIQITCPFCNSHIQVAIWEDGNPKRQPVVFSGLIYGKAECPICKKIIYDEILNEDSKRE